MLKSLSTSFIVRGLLAFPVGIVALAWPGVTVLALVVLFAIYAFIAAGMEVVKAFSSERAGPVMGHLLLGLVDIGAGMIAWRGRNHRAGAGVARRSVGDDRRTGRDLRGAPAR